jgi:hypothetical protein
MRRSISTALVSVMFMLSGAAAPAGAANDDATLRVLALAVERQAGDSRNDLMLPLRRLRDPGLRALWGGLASSEREDLRRHGVLGLAELEVPPRLTPILLAKIKDPTEQALILGEAMAGELVPAVEVPAMLRIEGLDPLVEVVLRGRLEKPTAADTDRLVSLATDAGPAQRVLAGLVLARSGKPELLGPAVEAFAEQPEPARGAKAGTLLSVISREKLTGGGVFFERLASIYGEDRTLHADILRIWLRADPSTARPALAKAVANAASPTDLARLALAALDAADRLKVEDFDAFPSEDPSGLFTSLVNAGRAIAKGESDGPLVTLARDRSRSEVQLWCAQRSKDWSDERAMAVCRALVESWAERGSPGPVGDAVGVAVARLAELGDWKWLGDRVEAGCAAGDHRFVTAIFTGLLSGDAKPGWNLPEQIRWPDATTSAAAALFAGRSSESTAKDQSGVARLRDIAAGLEGRMPMPLRVQAAWLATRSAGAGDAAIARLLASVK